MQRETKYTRAGSYLFPRANWNHLRNCQFYYYVDSTLWTALYWPKRSCMVYRWQFQDEWTVYCLEDWLKEIQTNQVGRSAELHTVAAVWISTSSQVVANSRRIIVNWVPVYRTALWKSLQETEECIKVGYVDPHQKNPSPESGDRYQWADIPVCSLGVATWVHVMSTYGRMQQWRDGLNLETFLCTFWGIKCQWKRQRLQMATD